MRWPRPGVPDVQGGAVIEKRFVAALAAVRDAYARADRADRGAADDRRRHLLLRRRGGDDHAQRRLREIRRRHRRSSPPRSCRPTSLRSPRVGDPAAVALRDRGRRRPARTISPVCSPARARSCRMGGTARISVVVEERWRAVALVAEMRARGFAATCVSTVEEHFGVRTPYSSVLAAARTRLALRRGEAAAARVCAGRAPAAPVDDGRRATAIRSRSRSASGAARSRSPARCSGRWPASGCPRTSSAPTSRACRTVAADQRSAPDRPAGRADR